MYPVSLVFKDRILRIRRITGTAPPSNLNLVADKLALMAPNQSQYLRVYQDRKFEVSLGYTVISRTVGST